MNVRWNTKLSSDTSDVHDFVLEFLAQEEGLSSDLAEDDEPSESDPTKPAKRSAAKPKKADAAEGADKADKRKKLKPKNSMRNPKISVDARDADSSGDYA